MTGTNLRILLTAFLPVLLCGCVEVTSIGSPQVNTLLADLQNESKLIGRNKAEILKLFGPPSFKNSNEEEWYYVNLEVRNILGVSKIKESSVICLNFDKNGLVKSTRSYKNAHKNINTTSRQKRQTDDFKRERFKSALRREQKKKSRVRDLFNTESGSDKKLINNR